MNPNDFTEEAPGTIETTDTVFGFSPDPLPPDLRATHELVRLNGQAMYGLAQLSNLETWLDSPQIVLSPLIHREAVDSSNIETISEVTLSDLYKQESGENPGTTPTERSDIQEAQNYVRAITTGLDRLQRGDPLDLNLLQDLHAILLEGARGEAKNPGELRDRMVGLDEPGTPLDDARFVPMDPATVPYALRALLQYIKSGPTYAPLVDIAMIHYQFETIHPFNDGNGRLGRLLIMLVAHEWNLLPGPYLYPSSYFNRNRTEYLDRLHAVSTSGAWEEWILFFLQAVADQGDDCYAVAQSLFQLRTRYREQYQKRGSVIREVIDAIIERPYFTEKQVVSQLNRSQPAVNRAISTLWNDGVIAETTGNDRNRRYEFPEVLEVVEPRSRR